MFINRRPKSNWPVTRVKKTEPQVGSKDWVIWAAWADRITFEEIYEKSGFREPQVISLMQGQLKPKSFCNWRKRVGQQSIKHRKLFANRRSIQSLLKDDE